MKLPSLLLTGSVAANAVLLACFILRPSPPQAAGSPANPVALTAPTTPSTPAVEDLGPGFAALTPEQLRGKLQALGFPKNIVDQLVRSRIYARSRAHAHELVVATLPTVRPWRLAALRNDRFSVLTPAQRKEVRDLEAEARDEALRLLGPEQLDRDGLVAFKYGFVPPAKAVLLDALERDYENLNLQFRDETRNLKTPADEEREKFLRAEHDRDLAALLTPAELDAFQLRASPTALDASFQSKVRAFQPTEEEYRALFALQKAAEARSAAGESPPNNSRLAGVTGATMMFMNGGIQLPDADVRAALGDARFNDWQLANQAHYQSLANLAAANNLSPATVKQVAVFVNETTDASWRIADDATLTIPQKKAALADLAASARAQVAAQLGPALAEDYLKSGRWFDALAAGSAVKLDGSSMAFRPVDPPPRPASPARPTP